MCLGYEYCAHISGGCVNNEDTCAYWSGTCTATSLSDCNADYVFKKDPVSCIDSLTPTASFSNPPIIEYNAGGSSIIVSTNYGSIFDHT